MINKPLLTLISGAVIASLSASAQTSDVRNFSIGAQKYYIHQIASIDMSHIDPKASLWNQNMVADNQYIYLADHTDNSSSRLTIKRFTAHDCTPVSDIVISKEDMEYYFLDELTDDERCFYLCPCDESDYLILFFNTPANGIKPNDGFYFYLIDKEGNITNEYQIRNVPGNDFEKIGDFGIPAVIGFPSTGDFEILIPMVDWNGNTSIANYTFKNSQQTSSYVAFYSSNSSGTAYTKPSVHIINDTFMVIDDNDITPSIYSYRDNTNLCFGSIDTNHVMGHGFKSFDYDGHRFVCTGDVADVDEYGRSGVTQFNLGLWDNDTAPAKVKSRAGSTVDFTDYKPITSLQFNKSNISYGSSSTYRQFAATSDFGSDVSHLHLYVPGEFLATYQINKENTPTSVAPIQYDPDLIRYSYNDGVVTFDRPVGNVSVFDTVGRCIFSSRKSEISVNLTNFVKGVYIIVAEDQSFKIII